MKILAIDTSCDETSVAVVENDWIISNKISSQIELHKKWGGVVPNIAKVAHQENIDFVIQEALIGAKTKIEEIDAFAVTQGPGLAIALEVGIKKAKELSQSYNKPLIAVNHMEGHIYSALAKNSKGNPRTEYTLPLLALLISGGHTELVLMKDHGQYEVIGETLDDAVGEAFDKVAKMLDLGYPGGPVLEKLAKEGDKNAYTLPIPMKQSKDANMSYSGLKTAVKQLVEKSLPINQFANLPVANDKTQESKADSLVNSHIRKLTIDMAASFQKVAIESLILKTEFALNSLKEKYKIQDLVIAGGVSANLAVRKAFRNKFQNQLRIHFPISKRLYGDNAAMIGVAAYFNALHGRFVEDLNEMDRKPNWRIDHI
jgi:N6-L-threonylcarbamoyladenine synthase